jgi:hypothetical protein
VRDWYYLQHQNEQTAQPDLFIRDACTEILTLKKQLEDVLESLDNASMDAIYAKKQINELHADFALQGIAKQAAERYATKLEEMLRWIYDNRGWRFDQSEYGIEVQRFTATLSGHFQKVTKPRSVSSPANKSGCDVCLGNTTGDPPCPACFNEIIDCVRCKDGAMNRTPEGAMVCVKCGYVEPRP